MADIIIWVILPLLAFGIMMFFFAWAGSVIARRRIARLLQPDEIILRKAESVGGRLPRRLSVLSLPLHFMGWLGEGTLYLTNKRLVRRRSLLAVHGLAVLEMPLDSIDECSVKRLGWFGSLQIKASGELLLFHPYRHYWSPTRIGNRAFAEEMAKAINEARAVVQGASL
jgi:hypothetical protein